MENPLLETLRQILCQPFGQSLRFRPSSMGDTAPDLGNRHHADERTALMESVQPFQNSEVGRWLRTGFVSSNSPQPQITRFVAPAGEVELGTAQRRTIRDSGSVPLRTVLRCHFSRRQRRAACRSG